MCMKLAGEKLDPGVRPGQALKGKRVFCSDMTFDASVNPIVYEDGEAVFIDTERDTWNMDPVAWKKPLNSIPMPGWWCLRIFTESLQRWTRSWISAGGMGR